MSLPGKILIGLGGLLILAGLLVELGSRLPVRLGRLPGDIVIRGKSGVFYFPLMTCLLVSAVLTLAQVLPEVKSFRYAVERGIEFTDPAGKWPVFVGTGSDVASRVEVWKALSASLVSRKAQPQFIDVRFPQAPFYGR